MRYVLLVLFSFALVCPVTAAEQPATERPVNISDAKDMQILLLQRQVLDERLAAYILRAQIRDKCIECKIDLQRFLWIESGGSGERLEK
jgi:hypothetical protein